jgi:hypothetical protein
MTTRKTLLPNSTRLRLGPGVHDNMVDWQDRHDGCRHPLQYFYITACATKYFCVDFTPAITEELYVARRLGMNTLTAEQKVLEERRRALRAVWPGYGTYARDQKLLLRHAAPIGITMSVHHAEYGMVQGYYQARSSVFYSPGSLVRTDANPLGIAHPLSLAELYRNISACHSDIPPQILALPLNPSDPIEADVLEDAGNLFVQAMMAEQPRIWFADEYKGIVDRLRKMYGSISVVALADASPCMCCGRK